MQPFLTEMLDWVDQKDFNLDNCSISSPTESFLEIDLDYLEDLHDFYNVYPLANEKMGVGKEIL